MESLGPTPIACELYDHLEVACMHRYEIRLFLKDGSVHEGQAKTTRTGSDKIEYLIILVNGQTSEIPMHELARVEVLSDGASFREIVF